VPLCPTYRLLQTESESPRGRVALMQALTNGSIAPEPGALGHLDHCLACRACERACPSGVRYGDLLDATRTLLARAHGRHPRVAYRFLLSRLTHTGPVGAYRLARAGWLVTRAGGRGLLKRLGLKQLQAMLPDIARPVKLPGQASPAQAPRARVELFAGCAGGVLDRETLHAALTLLTRLGFAVDIPAAQRCCGALAWHQGERDTAIALMRKNTAAFAKNDDTVVLCGVSGCTAFLQDYGKHIGAPTNREFLLPEGEGISGGSHVHQPQAQTLAQRTQDLTRFLAAQPLHELAFKPLPQRVAVHEPCLHRNVLRSERDLYTLVQAIPHVQAIPLADNHLCCGAAGEYFLREPTLAAQLAQQKLAALKESGAHILVTSNVGCALHLKAALSAAGGDIEVLHPVTLLGRQLQASS
jgi:glycolate oxidase iron-sulfur subunit